VTMALAKDNIRPSCPIRGPHRCEDRFIGVTIVRETRRAS
jgi:hypothetical protein